MERQPNVDSFLYPFPVSNAPLNYLTSQDRSKSLAIKMREAYLVSTEVVICSISACTRGWERSRVLCPKTPQIIPNFSWRPQVNSPIQLTRGDIALKRLAAARPVFCIHTRICDSGNLLIFPPMSGNRRWDSIVWLLVWKSKLKFVVRGVFWLWDSRIAYLCASGAQHHERSLASECRAAHRRFGSV